MSKTHAKVSAQKTTNGIATWDAYASAYAHRYGTLPVRNQTVNSLLKRLVEKLGSTEAPHVAGFYLTHNLPFYVTKRHPVNLLVADAEGLRTQWATGIKATTGEAKEVERHDNSRAIIDAADKILRGGL